MGRIFCFGDGDNSGYGDSQKEPGMNVEGMPQQFWVVVKPKPNSKLGDVCFECDFRRFAFQVRGGLEVDEIFGIYADSEVAKVTATKLIAAISPE